MGLPNARNDYGVAIVDLVPGEDVLLGLFSDVEGIGERIIRYGDECMPMSFLLHDRRHQNTYHAALDLDSLLEKLALIADDRRLIDSSALSIMPASVVFAVGKRGREIIDIVENTVFVTSRTVVKIIPFGDDAAFAEANNEWAKRNPEEVV